MFRLNFCVFVKIQTKSKLIPEFNNTFIVSGQDWHIDFEWAFLNTEKYKLHLCF